MLMFRTAGSALRRLTLTAPWMLALGVLATTLLPAVARASELDLQLPTLDASQRYLLFLGLGVCVVGMLFCLMMFYEV
jgi:hypothetical protein